MQPLVGSRVTVHLVVASEEKGRNKECHPTPHPPTSSFLLAFVADHDVIWYGISIWSAWVGCPGYVTSNLLPTPSLLAFWRGSWRDSLAAAQALPSKTQNIYVLSTPF